MPGVGTPQHIKVCTAKCIHSHERVVQVNGELMDSGNVVILLQSNQLHGNPIPGAQAGVKVYAVAMSNPVGTALLKLWLIHGCNITC